MIQLTEVKVIRPELTDPCDGCGLRVGSFDGEQQYLLMERVRFGELTRPLIRLCWSCTSGLIREVEDFTTAGKRRKRDQWGA